MSLLCRSKIFPEPGMHLHSSVGTMEWHMTALSLWPEITPWAAVRQDKVRQDHFHRCTVSTLRVL